MTDVENSRRFRHAMSYDYTNLPPEGTCIATPARLWIDVLAEWQAMLAGEPTRSAGYWFKLGAALGGGLTKAGLAATVGWLVANGYLNAAAAQIIAGRIDAEDADSATVRLSYYAAIRARFEPAILALLKAAVQSGVAATTARGWIVQMVAADQIAVWIAVDLIKTSGLPDAQRTWMLNAAAQAEKAARGNASAYWALRNTVEAGACTAAEATTVANSLGVTKP